MNCDSVTIAAVRDEIESTLLGGRVERVIHPAELAVALEIYAGGPKRWLFASAHPQQARVHLCGARLARVSDKVSPLLLLMRKYVRDGRLVAVEQPPWERVLALRFEKRDDAGSLLTSRLIIEVMGRHSNIVLVSAEGRVLDAIKRVKPEMSRYRTILPQQPYVPPPPQGKSSPEDLRPGDLARLCAHATSGTPLAQALVNALAGFSPLLGREIAFRAAGLVGATVDDVDWGRVEAETLGLVHDVVAGNWNFCLGLNGGEVTGYAAYELRHFPERRAATSVSDAVEAYYSRLQPPTVAGETGKAGLRVTLSALLDRAKRRREALVDSLPRHEEAERLRRWGELLLAYASQISPGSEAAELAGERITLDRQLSPVEMAQHYFREYRKAKGGLDEVPRQVEQVDAELAFLAQVATDLDLASSPAEVEEVRQELGQAGLVKDTATQRKGRERPLPLGRPIETVDGFEILIGRSARQNERVTFELGAGNDIWLHARGVPGAHVLVKARGREVSEPTLHQAAGYAAYFSQSRSAASVAVDCTLRRHVRRINGGPPGLVDYSGERTLQASPTAPPKEWSARTSSGSHLPELVRAWYRGLSRAVRQRTNAPTSRSR